MTFFFKSGQECHFLSQGLESGHSCPDLGEVREGKWHYCPDLGEVREGKWHYCPDLKKKAYRFEWKSGGIWRLGMSTKIPGKEMKYSMQSYNGSRTHNVTKKKENILILKVVIYLFSALN